MGPFGRPQPWDLEMQRPHCRFSLGKIVYQNGPHQQSDDWARFSFRFKVKEKLAH